MNEYSEAVATETEYERSDYWGDLDPKALGLHVVQMRDDFRSYLRNNGIDFRWGKHARYFYSNYAWEQNPMNSSLLTLGEAGELTSITPNHLRSILKTSISSMLANPPVFSCNASNTDTQSKKNAELFQVVVDYYLQVYGIRDFMNKTVEQALLTDAAYMMIEWDPAAGKTLANALPHGDLSVTTLSGWDVCFDPVWQGGWNKLPYLITRQWVSRTDLCARFHDPDHPEIVEAIKSQPTRYELEFKDQWYQTRIRLTDGVTDQIELVKCWIAKSVGKPEGRMLWCLTDGTPLLDDPLPYTSIPVDRMVHDEDDCTLMGWSPINDLVPLQELYNELMSAVASTQVSTAVPTIIAPQGTLFEWRDVGHMKVVEIPDGLKTKIEAINFTATSPQVFNMIEALVAQMQLMAGVSNASRGQAGNQTSGSALLFQASQTVQLNSPAAVNYTRFASAIGTRILNLLQTFAHNPRTIAIMGVDNAQHATFDKTSFNTFDRVIAQLGNPMLATDQGKLQVANQLLQYGEISPDQYLEVMKTGNLDTATSPKALEMLFVDEEDDALRRGISVTALMTDDHKLHISKHRQLLNIILARMPNPPSHIQAMITVVLAHIDEHLKYERAAMGAQAAANPQSAPPTPAGPATGAPADVDPRVVGSENPVREQSQEIGVDLPRAPSMPRQAA